MSLRLDGMTVFVTGSGSGLGKEITTRAASEGAFVVATDVDEDGGQEAAAAAENVAEGAGGATFHPLDVTNAEAFHDLVDTIAEERGLDGIVNNAGIGHPPNLTEDVPMSTLDYILDVNVRGVWNGCQAALPHLKNNDDGGSVVNVASLAGFLGMPQQSAYSLTKGAVLNYTRVVAAEAGRDGVRANAVCPGIVDTPLGSQVFSSVDPEDPEAGKEKLAKQYPMGRLGEPDDVAAPTCFLLSDEASWVSGHGLVIDGGFSIA
jgi:NAD(P)-dependent dehydrogenase (short-subunit alcohol dehydrogenase family)